MNNEIRNSLVAEMPKARAGVPPSKNATQAEQIKENGKELPPAEKADRSEKPREQPDRQAVEDAAEVLESRAAQMGRDLRFVIDRESDITVIKVVDPVTEEVIRQLPSEEAVDRARAQSDDSFNLINETA